MGLDQQISDNGWLGSLILHQVLLVQFKREPVAFELVRERHPISLFLRYLKPLKNVRNSPILGL